ncbi:MAG: Hsp20/alpha crystallin family protein [Planctomycetia bacterium]|nr:Hsp20/alpha crystallin family protein [Planctomycetia bacterium]
MTPTHDTQAAAGEAASREPAPAPRTDMPLAFQPNVDICDRGAEVTIVADVPGARADAIDISFEDGILSVQAPVAARRLPGRGVRQEYGIGDYRRTFRLGNGFDASQISADYRRGVLTIHVPRLAAVLPRKIQVRIT